MVQPAARAELERILSSLRQQSHQLHEDIRTGEAFTKAFTMRASADAQDDDEVLEDDASRRDRLSKGWSANARYADPMMQGTGHDGIAAMIGGKSSIVEPCSPRSSRYPTCSDEGDHCGQPASRLSALLTCGWLIYSPTASKL